MSTAPAASGTASPRVVVIGDVMLDRYYEGTVDRISPEAPVPVLHVRRTFNRPGGAANVAVNVAAMGGTTRLVGAVGTDGAADQLRAVLAADGVACGDLVAVGSIPTTVKTRLIATHNQIARFDEESRFEDGPARRDLVSRIASAATDADLVLISDYVKGVCDETVCRAAIDAAARSGTPVIVDSKSHDFAMFRGASVITPNRNEATAAAGFPIRSPDDGLRAGRIIRERFGIDAVVVTLGEQGMVFVTESEADVIPTQARQVYDVTGAGDSVVAALSVALGRGLSMRQACLLANAAAGLQVARVGTSRISWNEMLATLDGQPAASRAKIVSRSELRQAVELARAEGKKIGFTNGCFDILHHGHVQLLEAAARECDLLVVGVNSDDSVRRLKGPPRPFVPAADRQAVLAGLAAVGLVCEFEEDTPLEIIKAVEPDVLVKGGDYRLHEVVGGDIVKARGGRVVTPLFVPDASTTGLVDRIRQKR
ncbi:MAG: bifunctional heptose 7-phosphate kinase/heptose 1-phosphate adenyltransferase [Planctomycetia bacterium]|nr:bifunctional heptose 7-phosphate kinase/heptose 1-phosphate adenyltransferase [Planctomycetia bacterium]